MKATANSPSVAAISHPLRAVPRPGLPSDMFMGVSTQVIVLIFGSSSDERRVQNLHDLNRANGE
jgi:hypothetical protein